MHTRLIAAAAFALITVLAACADSGRSSLRVGGGPSVVTAISTASTVTPSDSPPSAVASGITPNGSGSAVAGSGSVGPGRTVSASARQSTATAPPPQPHGGVLNLTTSDSGRTITVDLGTRIQVTLQPFGGSYDPPAVDDTAVLSQTSHDGGYPSDTAAVAAFVARQRGTAQIRSQTDFRCLHTTPACLPPQREFQVTITVH